MSDICKPHGKIVEYFSKTNGVLIGLCKECVLTAKPPIILAEALIKDIESKKSYLLNVIYQASEQNNQNLNRVKDSMINFKDVVLQKIDQIIEVIQNMKEMNENEKNNKITEINQFQTLDENQLIEYFRQINKTKVLKDQKQMLLNSLNKSLQKSFYKEIAQTLEKFPLNEEVQFEIGEDQIKQFKCQNHNLDVIGVDVNEIEKKNNLYCMKCISEQPKKFRSLDDISKLISEFKITNQKCSLDFLGIFENIIKTMNNCVDRRVENVKTKFRLLQNKMQEMNDKKKQKILSHIKILKNFQLDLNGYQEVSNLRIMEKFLKSDQFQIQNSLNNLQSKTEFISEQSKFTSQDVLILAEQLQNKIVSYGFLSKEIIQEFRYQLTNCQIEMFHCSVVSINYDAKFLVATNHSSLTIFEFAQDKFVEFQTLQGHTDWVFCLQFMNKDNQIISAGQDQKIKIWKQQQNKKWVESQTLKEHTLGIVCLALNRKNDLLVSGSYDKTIKFWELKNSKWRKSQTISIHQLCVVGLSFNDQETKFVSCGQDQQILVMECNLINKEWVVVQKIQTEFQGYGLCFISDDLFAFQPNKQQFLQIFQYDKNTASFSKIKEVQVPKSNYTDGLDFFPQKYIKSKQIIMNKNGNRLNFIQKFNGNQFKFIQSIELSSNKVCGTITDDGNCLIYSECFSNFIKIRQFVEI